MLHRKSIHRGRRAPSAYDHDCPCSIRPQCIRNKYKCRLSFSLRSDASFNPKLESKACGISRTRVQCLKEGLQGIDQDVTNAYKYAIIVQYVGTKYQGWQYQPRKTSDTIQGRIMLSLGKIFGVSEKELRMRAASRTDSGVHAHGQVVEFYSPKPIENKRKFLFSMNSTTPSDIRIPWVSNQLPDSFHVIQDVRLKQYNYYIAHSEFENPFTYGTRLSVHGLFDFELFAEGARQFEGVHDFGAFSNKSLDPIKREPTRQVSTCKALRDKDGICLQVQGKGFLYRQVRHMVGALLLVAKKKMPIETLKVALNQGYHFVTEGNRKWKPAPAHGLHLMWIAYDEHIPHLDDFEEFHV